MLGQWNGRDAKQSRRTCVDKGVSFADLKLHNDRCSMNSSGVKIHPQITIQSCKAWCQAYPNNYLDLFGRVSAPIPAAVHKGADEASSFWNDIEKRLYATAKKKIKYIFQPPTHIEVGFSTMKAGNTHPPTIKTGQIWSFTDFRNGFFIF